MAQFDVHRRADGKGLLVDCQSELLEHLNTRFVVPLLPRDEAPAPAHRLNPVFRIEGEEYVLVTQFAAAVERRLLGEVLASLEPRSYEVTGALDVLLSGV